jgi:deoxyinosine 3'endonuclease (endonuclease V)
MSLIALAEHIDVTTDILLVDGHKHPGYGATRKFGFVT